MSCINEKISQEEVIDRFTSLVKEISIAHNEIEDCISEMNYPIEKLMEILKKHKIHVKGCSSKADNVAKGNFGIERYSEAAYPYIKDVDG